MTGLQRAAAALLAAVALCAALGLSVWHPVAPAGVLAGVWLVAVAVAWRPACWLFWLPALMPVLNFYPWTGWWLVDESDLFVLAVLAGGYARWAWVAPAPALPGPPRGLLVLAGALALCVAQALVRGWLDAPTLPPHHGWRDALWQGLYADHLSAWNSVRVAKSFVWALLLAPLAWRILAHPSQRAALSFVRGMLTGLALVCVLVVWEREAQVGLLDFVSGYRTSAAFWEMHVGGGAIDAYLALAAPLALWVVWVAPPGVRWWLALGLLWLTIYTLLTTYSRGVMAAFVVAVLGWALAARMFELPHDGHGPGRRRVVALTLAALLVQGLVVIGAGAFLGQRLESTSQDVLGRWTHWQRGVALLQKPVSEHASPWWGLGMGRFAAQYRELGALSELPGRATWQRQAEGQGVLVLNGPDSRDSLALQFGLMQRVQLRQPRGYTARLRLAGAPGDTVLVSLCLRHLIHSMVCQGSTVQVASDDPTGQRSQTVALRGHALIANASGPLQAAAQPAALMLQATQAGQRTQVLEVQLSDAQGRVLLRNTHFSAGLSHWMPAAEAYFQPWHTDNLYLDLLLELGAVGWLLLAALVLWTLRQLVAGMAAREALAWAYAAALLGFLAVGVVISASEIPRVLLLTMLTAIVALVWCQASRKR